MLLRFDFSTFLKHLRKFNIKVNIGKSFLTSFLDIISIKRKTYIYRRVNVDNSGERVALWRHDVQAVQILPNIRADQLHLPGCGYCSRQALGHCHPIIKVKRRNQNSLKRLREAFKKIVLSRIHF